MVKHRWVQHPHLVGIGVDHARRTLNVMVRFFVFLCAAYAAHVLAQQGPTAPSKSVVPLFCSGLAANDWKLISTAVGAAETRAAASTAAPQDKTLASSMKARMQQYNVALDTTNSQGQYKFSPLNGPADAANCNRARTELMAMVDQANKIAQVTAVTAASNCQLLNNCPKAPATTTVTPQSACQALNNCPKDVKPTQPAPTLPITTVTNPPPPAPPTGQTFNFNAPTNSRPEDGSGNEERDLMYCRGQISQDLALFEPEVSRIGSLYLSKRTTTLAQTYAKFNAQIKQYKDAAARASKASTADECLAAMRDLAQSLREAKLVH